MRGSEDCSESLQGNRASSVIGGKSLDVFLVVGEALGSSQVVTRTSGTSSLHAASGKPGLLSSCEGHLDSPELLGNGIGI